MVTVTKYVWDPVFDCVSHELDENNDVKAVYHNEPQQYGGVLSQRRGSNSHYHHHDALGSTRFLTDSSGNVTDTYLNDAWGNSVASTGTTVNPFKWVGKYGYYTDDSTGQVYVRARMYQPAVARWTTQDSLGFSDGPNKFRIDNNIPVYQIDPSGNASISIENGWTLSVDKHNFGRCGEIDNNIELIYSIPQAAGPATTQMWQINEITGFVLDNACTVHTFKRTIVDIWEATKYLANSNLKCNERGNKKSASS